MPFYDLYCAVCDKEFNIMATMADKTDQRIPCPECGSTKVETVYNAAPAYVKRNTNNPECPKSNVCADMCPHMPEGQTRFL